MSDALPVAAGRDPRVRLGTIAAVLAAVLSGAAPELYGDTARMVDGGSVEGDVEALAAGELVMSVKGVKRRIRTEGVESVTMGAAPSVSLMAQQGRHVVMLDDGSRIGIEDASIADGKLKARTAFGDASIPLQRVVRLLRPAAHEKAIDVEPLVSKLGIRRGDTDTLAVASAGGQAVAVGGILLRLSSAQVTIEYEGTESSLPSETVRVVEMARPAAGAGTPAAPAATLILSDGSAIGVESMAADGAFLTVKSPGVSGARIARGAVSEVRFAAAKSGVLLSDLTPSVRQTGFFDELFQWRRNRSVAGGPLQVRGKTYESGIGVHPKCALTYALGRGFRSLSALVGIDDSVRSGAAILSVEVDGKVGAAPARIDAGKAPLQLTIDVSGVDKLTLNVDFVDGSFGSGARVDVCDAVLMK